MKFSIRRSIFSAAALVALGGVAPRASAISYQFTDLGVHQPGTTFTLGTALNESGQVVGWGFPPGFVGDPQPFLWSDSDGFTNTGALSGPGGFSNNFGINSLGHIAGFSETPDDGPFHAHLWIPTTPNGTTGTVVDLGALIVGGESNGRSMNDYGQVVGYVEAVDDTLTAMLWTPDTANDDTGTMISLGTLPDTNASTATAVNSGGTVIGNASLTVSNKDRAFVWTPDSSNGQTGTMTELVFEPDDTDFTRANGINNAGLIVGEARGDIDDTLRALLWTSPNDYTDLGTLPGDVGARASDINNLGQVVGESNDGTNTSLFIWSEATGMVDLLPLIVSIPSGWSLSGVIAINDAGWILGTGVGPNGFGTFLLTPVPEPASAGLLLIGGGTLCVIARRRQRVRRSS